MSLHNKYVTFLLSVSIFVLFFSFFFITSNILPHGAGPDWKSNTDVTKFIYENDRLAVLPDDEKDLHFTVYGGTRALRPPLSYIVSAVAAKALAFTNLDSYVLFRKGSALLCALALALTFYALSIYFNSYTIGILGSTILGLMPQFTFIASYNNDDSGAIFSATLMIAVLVRIYRYGASNTNAILIGLAGGLVVLSKMTAWLLMPSVILFLIIFFRSPVRPMLRYIAIAGVVFILAGGWWFAFNTYHYGINDPLLKKITTTVIEQHRRLPPGSGVGFAAQGVGFYELLAENYKNFLGETAKATIGNLDWLKLKVGPLQYTVYLGIFFFALFYYFFSLSAYLIKRCRNVTINDERTRQLIFESLLLLMIVFQITMYTWTNINNDIQIQGKYIIPIFLAILLLFFSGIYRLPGLIAVSIRKLSESGFPVNTSNTGRFGVFLASLMFVVYVHWDAWQNYVIPFYQPPAYDIKLGEFHSIPLNLDLNQRADSLDIRETNGGIEYISTGKDPKVIFKKDICQKISTTSMLFLEFYAKNAGTLQFFIDEGGGFSANISSTAAYKQGDNTLLLPISANKCQHLRFDPFIENGTFILKKFKIAPMTIVPRRKK